MTTDQPKEYTITGKVVKVADGDTITVLVGKQQHRVRLEGIDCPETGQPFGQPAKQFTSKQCFGKTVSVKVTGKGRYGRLLGDVLVKDKSVNRALLAAGLAWHYRYYNKDKTLAALEKAAQARRTGLWLDKSPIAPWEWRKRKRTRTSREPTNGPR